MKEEPYNNQFECLNCHEKISTQGDIGTENRNHCPLCLFSQHVDDKVSGDRLAQCGAPMEPIGLTFKHEGTDKYGKPRQGELMLIHKCVKCGRISINRIAGDDESKKILEVFQKSQNMSSEEKGNLEKQKIEILDVKDINEIKKQLFGKK